VAEGNQRILAEIRPGCQLPPDRPSLAFPPAGRAARRETFLMTSPPVPPTTGTTRAVSLGALLPFLADGKPHAAAALACDLGTSRASVRKQIEALRARGLPVEVAPGRGYVLPWPLELLDRARIRRMLDAATRARMGSFAVMWEPDSTSSELLARTRPADLSFVLAESQRAGRGRRGRNWLSPPGLNIYLSCLKRFDSGVAGLTGLSLAVGVMLMRALADAGVRDAGLKWPNDVLAGDAKLAGILVELEGEEDGTCKAVVGVGVNLRLPQALRTHAGQPVADLAQLAGGQPPPRNRFAARLVARLVEGLDEFARGGFGAFAGEYAHHDVLRGRELRVGGGSAVLHGRGAGIDARGVLLLQTTRGIVAVDSAEVSVRRA
jgi:BirA family biotin operon repressor/biotin-[acetyl-CoA-carboxylase] ligase